MLKKMAVPIAVLFVFFGMMETAGAAAIFVNGVSAATGWTDIDKSGGAYSGPESNLCWAIAAANNLAYTGWTGVTYQNPSGPTTFYNSAADIYGYFKKHFNNTIGNSMTGAEWWFAGLNKSPTATLKDGVHTGFYSEPLYLNNITFREPSSQGNAYPLVPTASSKPSDGDMNRLGWIHWYILNNRGTSIAIKGKFSGTGPDYIHFLTVWGVDDANNTIYVTDSDRGANTLDSYTIGADLHLSAYYANFVWTGLYGVFQNSSSVGPSTVVLPPIEVLNPPTNLRIIQ